MKERATAAWLREQGWVVTTNTYGAFDMTALKAGETPRLIEVKTGPARFGNYPPAERALTLAAALQAGADAYLAWWKLRAREPEMIPWWEWPEHKEGKSEA